MYYKHLPEDDTGAMSTGHIPPMEWDNPQQILQEFSSNVQTLLSLLHWRQMLLRFGSDLGLNQ